MPKIDKHGLKMIGLKAAVGQMTNSPKLYNEIIYNTSTGEIRIKNMTCTSYTSVVAPEIRMGVFDRLTMQCLADRIKDCYDRTLMFNRLRFEEDENNAASN